MAIEKDELQVQLSQVKKRNDAIFTVQWKLYKFHQNCSFGRPDRVTRAEDPLITSNLQEIQPDPQR